MTSDRQSAPRKRRHSKACTRCRKRKIRCDFQYPKCGACTIADATCLGYDSVHGANQPRSATSHLEQEVARLEAELERINRQSKTHVDVAIEAVDKLSTDLATTVVLPQGLTRKQEIQPPLTSSFFLSGSPPPYLIEWSHEYGISDHEEDGSSSQIKLSSVPDHVVNTMLKHYCEIYRPLYPAVEETDLFEAYDRVYNNKSPSPFDIFCVHITLAISMQTLMHRDEKRATSASYGFWSTAVGILRQAGITDLWERLQVLQLLTHYGFLNPKHVDCSKCAAAATRLCLQLGLQHEIPLSLQKNLDPAALSSRRRIFWHSYNIDCAVHTVRCRPFLWPRSASTAQFSDTDSQSSTSRQFCLLREIESEIAWAMYYPTLVVDDLPWNGSFRQWFTGVHERLNMWYQTTHQSINHGEKIQFHELLYQCQIMRLNRPSPRCPNPTLEMRKKTVQSATAVLKEFGTIERVGKLFNIWHASYFMMESGCCILGIILSAMETSRDGGSRLEEDEMSILSRYLPTLPHLLWKLSRRWPDVAQHAAVMNTLCETSLERFDSWSKGKTVDRAEIARLKHQLLQNSRFSPLPADTSEPGDTSEPFLFPEMYPTFLEPGLPNDAQLNFDPLELVVPAGDGASNTAWIDPQVITMQDTSNIPDIYGFHNDDALIWDFEGLDSEEILAALAW
ncbi:hypothetical protein PV10_05710 [Exophiala mesophila]|uniref:Zn(2)-C6 fungal-type domain-containing protein n=1 Tax=Exophiala mesophila TaxID=212818 RepID=A0A0D1ZAX5_EXOME|nr:uncharacterized protein PV10_05710 [Exophiala mesophila]KIV91134.1 hypothetical protein PV10_05710 [Exophiala mesophila]